MRDFGSSRGRTRRAGGKGGGGPSGRPGPREAIIGGGRTRARGGAPDGARGPTPPEGGVTDGRLRLGDR